jgi:hypothetical protein
VIVAIVLFGVLGVVTFWGFAMRRNNWDREVAREVAHRAKHIRRTAWMDYARERHFQLWRARAGPTYVLRATREDIPLVIDVYLSEAIPSVRIRARAPKPQARALKAWRSDAGGPPPEDDAQDELSPEPPPVSPTRDAAFDEAYRVKGNGADVRSVLDERVRRALLAVPSVTCFEYDRGDVRLEWTGGDPSFADAGIEAVIAACSATA